MQRNELADEFVIQRRRVNADLAEPILPPHRCPACNKGFLCGTELDGEIVMCYRCHETFHVDQFRD